MVVELLRMIRFSQLYFKFSTLRKMVVFFYNLVLLTTLIATAFRDLHCDDHALCELDDHGHLNGLTSRPAAVGKATPDTWRSRILYAAAALAGASKHRGVLPGHSASVVSTQKNGKLGRRLDSDAIDASKDVGSDSCSGAHGLQLYQENTTSYLEGLPVYHVTVINTCLDCSVEDIHIACGDWASATEVNPLVFKRVSYNDCVVNDGKPISSQGVIFFEYTNSFPYPMHLQSSSPTC